jgi:hypothetical protein
MSILINTIKPCAGMSQNRTPDEGRYTGTTTEDILQEYEGTTVEEETV